MAAKPALIRQSELTRYLKAWGEAGYPNPRVEIRIDGTVVMVPADDKSGDGKNDWD
ncbi:hypothetical protein [Cereibacter johrii]|uniref:hypothetical protein n=1 Tax=Cereibacter johrii TaxID=445629 RepID=UPI00167D1242|nr:hypothetical protein [Cereibacter johrii]